MPAVFERVRCAACGSDHDVYVLYPKPGETYEFACPRTGEWVAINPKRAVNRVMNRTPLDAIMGVPRTE